MNKSYRDLLTYDTFEDRFNYLKIGQKVGEDTFGFDRYLNQIFYRTNHRWKDVRTRVILRDNGKELGIDDRDIVGPVIVHHINPITKNDLISDDPKLYDPDNLICVSNQVHRALHYGDISLVPSSLIERVPNDTCPWR